MEYDIEKIRKHFLNDKFMTFTGVQIDEVGDDYAVLSLEIKDHHKNAAGGVQGGAIFTLADSAFAVACNATWIMTGESAHKATVAQSNNITFHHMPKGNKLFVRAERVQQGRLIGVYHHTITDELGTNVAFMVGTSYTVTF
jgi:acyl-CoA thioesterase